MSASDSRPALMSVPKTADNQSDDAGPRAVLGRAIEAAAVAAGVAMAASAAAERGRDALGYAAGALAPYADLDDRVAGFHAAAAKAGEPPGRALPPDLIEARRDRAAAAEGLADAEAALALLDGEAEAAAREAEAAKVVIHRAVDSVCAEVCRTIIDRIRTVETEAARLRNGLRNYLSSRLLSDPPVDGSLTLILHDVQDEPLLLAYSLGWNNISLDWNSFRKALAADPAAQLKLPGQ